MTSPLTKVVAVPQLCLDEDSVDSREVLYSTVSREVSLRYPSKFSVTQVWLGCGQGAFYAAESGRTGCRFALSRT